MTLLWVGLGMWMGLLLGGFCTAIALGKNQEGRLDRLHDAQAAERAAWAEERRDLNNRIQVPDAAPFMQAETPIRQHVPYDDDAAFQAAQEEISEWP